MTQVIDFFFPPPWMNRIPSAQAKFILRKSAQTHAES